jgi:lysophospholipase L1-like esterase
MVDGSGGSAGAGGVTATGGTHATGGSSATGGSVGLATGGTSMGSGGRDTASGGATSSGGAVGSGGVPIGSGGITGGAGSRGSGGGTGPGGTTGSGGAAGSGGMSPGIVAAGVRWIGRVDLTDAQHPRFAWSGTGFVARFMGTSLAAQLNNGGSATIFKAVVDGSPQPVIRAGSGQASYTLATGLGSGVHTVELYKQTEGAQGNAQLMGLTVGGGGGLMTPPEPPSRFLEIVGDSITCGYGTLGKLADSDCFPTESHWDTYGAVAARALGAELSTVATSGQGAYRNYGGDMMNTMPMVYDRTLTNAATPTWDFRVMPQAVMINLGTNDISNGKGDPGTPFRDAYLGLVQNIRSKYPQALIVCLIGPLLSGSELDTIRAHISAVVAARRTAGDTNIEFFDQIAAQTSEKAACQYHPNPAENQLMADLLAAELRTRLHW